MCEHLCFFFCCETKKIFLGEERRIKTKFDSAPSRPCRSRTGCEGPLRGTWSDTPAAPDSDTAPPRSLSPTRTLKLPCKKHPNRILAAVERTRAIFVTEKQTMIRLCWRLVSVGIMGAELRALLNLLKIRALWYGFSDLF